MKYLRHERELFQSESISLQYNGPWPHIRGNNVYTGQSPYVAQPPNQILFSSVFASKLYILKMLFFKINFDSYITLPKIQ